jgi:hypothetical protein
MVGPNNVTISWKLIRNAIIQHLTVISTVKNILRNIEVWFYYKLFPARSFAELIIEARRSKPDHISQLGSNLLLMFPDYNFEDKMVVA